jgi:hypothetical protein
VGGPGGPGGGRARRRSRGPEASPARAERTAPAGWPENTTHAEAAMRPSERTTTGEDKAQGGAHRIRRPRGRWTACVRWECVVPQANVRKYYELSWSWSLFSSAPGDGSAHGRGGWCGCTGRRGRRWRSSPVSWPAGPSGGPCSRPVRRLSEGRTSPESPGWTGCVCARVVYLE